MNEMYERLGISEKTLETGNKIIRSLKDRFDKIDENAEYNQLKVLKAMQECRVQEGCLNGTTGYGSNDLGRETLENVYAKVFSSFTSNANNSNVRP